MIDRLVALARRFQQDAQVILDLLLPDIFFQAARAQAALDGLLFFAHLRRDEAVAHGDSPALLKLVFYDFVHVLYQSCEHRSINYSFLLSPRHPVVPVAGRSRPSVLASTAYQPQATICPLI